MSDSRADLVLVTGASGFIALHIVKALLDQGYRVRGTVRSAARSEFLRGALRAHSDRADELELVEATLDEDRGWDEAVAGCRYVMHVASPIAAELPKHEDDLIVPAREGTLRVLRAAAAAGVQRVVQTSSLAAVVYGHVRDGSRTFDETSWSVAETIAPYEKSKTLAERAAWDFVDNLPAGQNLELATINPGLVLGPVLSAACPASGEAVRKLMAREFPGMPRLGYAVVDVRDVADAHLAAMKEPSAAGERFCCATEHVWMEEIAHVINRHFADRGYKVPTLRLPNFLVKGVALFDKTTRMIVGELGLRQDIDTSKIRDRLGWKPRGLEEMVVDMGESLIHHGLV